METMISDVQINTIVQHYVCKIFQETARAMGVGVIRIEGDDADRLRVAAAELEGVLDRYVKGNDCTGPVGAVRRDQ